MAKVSAPIVPIELNDGSKFLIPMEEAHDIYEQLGILFAPPAFKPLNVTNLSDPNATTLQMPAQPSEPG